MPKRRENNIIAAQYRQFSSSCNMNFLQKLLLLFVIIYKCSCAKILGVFPSPGYSQFILCEKLMGQLARNGHDVTVISAFAPKNPPKNYRTILVDGLKNLTEVDLFQLEELNDVTNVFAVYELGFLLTEYVLEHDDVQNLIKSNETFDLVIVEQFFNEAHKGFAAHFEVPLVLLSSMGQTEWNTYLMGNRLLPSVLPTTHSKFTNHMNFFQRLRNSFVYLFELLYRTIIDIPRHQEYVQKYFPHHIDLKTVMYNASLMLLNSHVTTSGAATLTTAVVEVGGFHVDSKKLPGDLQRFLDDATDGAIFFSMGSNLNSSNLHEKTIKSILNVFSKLKQKVLWKFENENLPNKPKNLLISKWLPQSDILAHPNTVAFITHGGLLSLTEAIFHGVPIVGIPVFGDQKMNIARAQEQGYGVQLPFREITEKKFSNALSAVLDDERYRSTVKKMSNIMHDQPMKPLDRAIFWIEHVLRQNGAPHLKNASLDLSWYQLYLIDVMVFVFLLVMCLYYGLKMFLNWVCRKIVSPKKTGSRSVKRKTN